MRNLSPVLVGGEALFDFISAEIGSGLGVSKTFEKRIGGSPFNIAVGVRRLGVPVSFVGKFGDDQFGEALLEFLDRETIESRAHHDARLELVGGLDLGLRRTGLAEDRRAVREMLQSRRQELAFATEVAVQEAVIDAGPGRDLPNGCGGRTLLGEQLTGRLQHRRADLVFADWLRRGRNRCVRCSHLCTLADTRRCIQPTTYKNVKTRERS